MVLLLTGHELQEGKGFSMTHQLAARPWARQSLPGLLLLLICEGKTEGLERPILANTPNWGKKEPAATSHFELSKGYGLTKWAGPDRK